MTELAKRYGGSLYDLAAEEGLEARLLDELDTAVACFTADPQYYKLLGNPGIPKRERSALLDEAFGKEMHPYVVNFLKLLCDEELLRELRLCARAYRQRYYDANGIVEAVVTCAVQPDEAALDKLRTQLEARTGKQVLMQVRIDPDILGGIRVELGGERLDGTVRRQLDTLRSAIAAAASAPEQPEKKE